MNRNLIHLFDFYLAAMFVVGTARRIGQYRAFAGLALSMPGRWPKPCCTSTPKATGRQI